MVFCTNCGSKGSISVFSGGSWNTFLPCSVPVPSALVHAVTPGQIIWKWNPASGATGYKWNTLNDLASAVDMGNDTVKAETVETCGTSYTRYVWAYNGCGYSASLTMIQSTLDCWICGDPVTINHVAGPVAPVSKSVTYGTVTNIPGATTKCWITRNLGASQQATSVSDATEASAGWYWQFNRKQGYKHDGTIRTPNTTWITVIDENSDWLPASDPCTIEMGSSWRIPTYTEWNNVRIAGSWTNQLGPWNSALKMHPAGCLIDSNGSLIDRGSAGHYYSSTQNSSTNGKGLYFDGTHCSINNYLKASGFPLRCLKEN